MRAIAVRTSRWAGPAAVVVAAVSLEVVGRGRRRGGAIGSPHAAEVPDLTPTRDQRGSGAGIRSITRAALAGTVRWAGRVAIAGAVVVFALLVVGPQTGRYRTLTVLTASMRPAFPPGSVVVAVPIPVDEVAVGDVITYAIPVDDHRVVTHRVVEVVRPGVVRTQGDANNTADPWVAELKGQTAWKARASVPGLGYAIEALSGDMARTVSVIGMTVAGLVTGLRAIWRRPVVA